MHRHTFFFLFSLSFSFPAQTCSKDGREGAQKQREGKRWVRALKIGRTGEKATLLSIPSLDW
jgi:hypothetical protein